MKNFFVTVAASGFMMFSTLPSSGEGKDIDARANTIIAFRNLSTTNDFREDMEKLLLVRGVKHRSQEHYHLVAVNYLGGFLRQFSGLSDSEMKVKLQKVLERPEGGRASCTFICDMDAQASHYRLDREVFRKTCRNILSGPRMKTH